MPWRAKNRDSALRLPGTRRLCSAETISRSVRSGCSPIRARICSACSSKGEVLPPRGIGSAVPSSRKALHPPDRGTYTDVVLFGRFTSGCSPFHEPNDSDSQLTRIWSTHWPALRRINALDSLILSPLGIPIQSGRDVLVGACLSIRRILLAKEARVRFCPWA